MQVDAGHSLTARVFLVRRVTRSHITVAHAIQTIIRSVNSFFTGLRASVVPSDHTPHRVLILQHWIYLYLGDWFLRTVSSYPPLPPRPENETHH
jgi:hypothetical protein